MFFLTVRQQLWLWPCGRRKDEKRGCVFIDAALYARSSAWAKAFQALRAHRL